MSPYFMQKGDAIAGVAVGGLQIGRIVLCRVLHGADAYFPIILRAAIGRIPEAIVVEFYGGNDGLLQLLVGGPWMRPTQAVEAPPVPREIVLIFELRLAFAGGFRGCLGVL